MTGTPSASTALSAQAVRRRLKALNLEPLPIRPPMNLFAPARAHGDICIVSSVTPIDGSGSEIAGQVPGTATVDEAVTAAKWCAANSLGALCWLLEREDKRAFGALDVLVFCNTAERFGDQSQIADGASRVLLEVFPEFGPHTRGAIGAASLVRNSLVVLKASYAISA